MGRVDGIFNLAGGVGENIGTGGRRGSLGIPGMGKEASRAPQQLLASLILEGLQFIHDAMEHLVGFGEGVPFRRDVPIVEAIVINVDFIEELEKNRYTSKGIFESLLSVVPRHEGSAFTKGVTKAISHAVPIGGTKAHMLAHRFAGHYLIGIIVMKR